MFSVKAVLKAPGGCHAWVEERPIWEIDEIINSGDVANRERALADKTLYEMGEKPIELASCICWKQTEGRKPNLKNDFYKEVLRLSDKVINEDNKQAAVEFWDKYGPLIRSREPIITIGKLKNILGFFRMITDLWRACVYQDSGIIKRYLAKPNKIVDAAGTDISEWVSQFNEAYTKVKNKKHFLYLMDGKPFIFRDRDSFYGSEYCLELPSQLIKLIELLDRDPDKVYMVLQKVLTKNINDKLSKVRLAAINVTSDGSYVSLNLPSLYDAALFSFVHTAKQIRYCKCGCGQIARPESAYAGDSHRQGYYKECNPNAKLKDTCLAYYRGIKGKGKITATEYETIKKRVDDICVRDVDIEKELKAFCSKKGFPVWRPKAKSNFY